MEQVDTNQENLVHAALVCNGYGVYHHWYNSIGFRNQSLRHEHISETNTNVALEYLVNSNTSRNDVESINSAELFLSDVGLTALSLMSQEKVDDNRKIPLVQGPPLDLELGRSLAQRRSSRIYTGDPASFEYVSTLLRAANGVSAEVTAPLTSGKTVKMNYRTAPSAGGLYPIDLYLVSAEVTGLKKGIYRYVQNQDCLVSFLGSNAVDDLFNMCAFQNDVLSINRSSCVLLMIGSPWKSMKKYGNKGLKFIFHESGSISQNVHLAATALGLGSVDCGGFYENEVHKLFGINGVNQALIHSVIIGVPA